MSGQEMEVVMDWLSIKGNIEKLDIEEQAQLHSYIVEYVKKAAEIVIPAMSRDKESKNFLFKL